MKEHNQIKPVNVSAIQDAITEIYHIFYDICSRNGIRFSASFGSALGAIRHGGFIPWDDDLDIEMLRQEYEKFEIVARKELPAWLRLMSWDTTYSYSNLFPKIICTDPIRVSKVESESGLCLTQGLFIDIFIVDGFPAKRWEQFLRISKRGYVKLRQYLFKYENSEIVWRSFFAKLLNGFIGLFDWNVKSYYDTLKADTAIIRCSSMSPCAKVWLSCWASYDLIVARGRYGMEEDDYIKVREVPFGKLSILVMNNVEDYLCQLYGDWKKLPPIEDRIPSHVNKTKVAAWRMGFVNIEKRPILSIVIANYNYGRFINDAISSVIDQTCGAAIGQDGQHVLVLSNGECVELIVCDAKSSDNSVAVIERYTDCIAWWCSEPDKGQSDAFNKGFSHSTGRYLTWLNADDILIDGALDRFCTSAKKNPECQWFAGGCVWMDANLNMVSIHHARRFSKYVASCGTVSVHSPSSFFTKELLDSVGGVNIAYHYKMDRLLWSQFYYDKGVRYCKLRGVYFGLRMHPDAKVSGVEYYGKDKMGEITPGLRRNREEREMIAKIYPRKKIKKWPQLFEIDAYQKLIDVIETFLFRGCRYGSIRKMFR